MLIQYKTCWQNVIKQVTEYYESCTTKTLKSIVYNNVKEVLKKSEKICEKKDSELLIDRCLLALKLLWEFVHFLVELH